MSIIPPAQLGRSWSSGGFGLNAPVSGFQNVASPQGRFPMNMTSDTTIKADRDSTNFFNNQQYVTSTIRGTPAGLYDAMFNIIESSSGQTSLTFNHAHARSISQLNAILAGRLPLSSRTMVAADLRSGDIFDAFNFLGVSLGIGNVTNQVFAEKLQTVLNNIAHFGDIRMYNYWACFMWKHLTDYQHVIVDPKQLKTDCDLYFVLRRVQVSETVAPPTRIPIGTDNRMQALGEMRDSAKSQLIWQFFPLAIRSGCTVPKATYEGRDWTGFPVYIGQMKYRTGGSDMFGTRDDHMTHQSMFRYLFPISDGTTIIHWGAEAIRDPVKSVIKGTDMPLDGGLPTCIVTLGLNRKYR